MMSSIVLARIENDYHFHYKRTTAYKCLSNSIHVARIFIYGVGGCIDVLLSSKINNKSGVFFDYFYSVYKPYGVWVISKVVQKNYFYFCVTSDTQYKQSNVTWNAFISFYKLIIS
jgi:hypothetical protein